MAKGKPATGKPPKNANVAGKRGPGRPKGVPNKITKSIREMIEGAIEAKGGQKVFERGIEEQPAAFFALVGKVLPIQVQGEMAHSGGLTITWAPLLAKVADKRRTAPEPPEPPVPEKCDDGDKS